MKFRGQIVSNDIMKYYINEATLPCGRLTRWLIKECRVTVSAESSRASVTARRGWRWLLTRRLQRRPLQFSHQIYSVDNPIWRERTVPVVVL